MSISLTGLAFASCVRGMASYYKEYIPSTIGDTIVRVDDSFLMMKERGFLLAREHSSELLLGRSSLFSRDVILELGNKFCGALAPQCLLFCYITLSFIILVLVIFFVTRIAKYSKTGIGSNAHLIPIYFYLFDPISITAFAISPHVAYAQILVLLCIHLAQRRWIALFLVSFTALLMTNFSYFALLIPFLFMLKLDSYAELLKALVVYVCVCALIEYVIVVSTRVQTPYSVSWPIQPKSSGHLRSASASAFSPSLGLYWYLHAQMLHEYSAYFNLLWDAQPLLYALPIAIRFADRPLVANHSQSP